MTTRGAKKRLGTGQHRIAVVLPKKTYYALVKAAKEEERSIQDQNGHYLCFQCNGKYDDQELEEKLKQRKEE